MTKKNNFYLILTGLLGPIGLFFISKSGGITLTLLAVILGQSFYNEIGYVPFGWAIIVIVMSLVWGFSAIKNKNKGLYFPYMIDIYKKEDKDYKYILNTVFGIIQFAIVLAIIAFAYKIIVSNG